jgi:lantibiotic biosynthesis protein
MNYTEKKVFLETAWKIGCQLMKTAIWHNESCNWQGYSIEPLNGSFQPIIRTFGSDIYSGTSGIALFLNALYSEIKDPLLLKTIEGCVSQFKSNLNLLPEQGFYTGKPGVAAALIRLGKDIKRKEWIEDGITILKNISTSSLQNHEVDLISGASSTIPILLEVYQDTNENVFLDKATQLGDLLLNQANKNGDIWSWKTVPSQKDLTGFSHGSSGVALALLNLYVVTRNENYLKGSICGFNYERVTYDVAQQNWPDLRDDVLAQNSSNSCGMAWCHGAPGIAISRCIANKLISDAIYLQEMNIALTTTTKNVYNTLLADLNNTNYSLCHGIAGNSDILIECGGEEHLKLAEAVGIAGIKKYQQNDIIWPSGLNTNQYTPGLMLGIAGTGYFYLRLFNNKKYKSLLFSGI